MSPSRLAAAVACAAALALAACGDDAAQTTSSPSGEGGEPAGTSTVATQPPPTATTGVPKGGVTQTTSTGEAGAGGAGDEEPARVPVALTHRAGALSPTTVTVPAFLTIAVTISGPKTTATLPGGATLAVPGAKTLTGLKPGRYAITTADGGRTTLDVVTGGDPGP